MIFIVALIMIISIPILLVLAIWKMGKSKRRWIRILSLIPFGTLAFLSYQAYFAFYPKEEFYQEVWTQNTGLQLPRTSKFIKKSASYPDQHGDYWAAAIIELSPSDHELLRKEVALSTKTQIDTTIQRIGISMGFNDFVSDYPKSELNEVYLIDEGVWFKIGFYKDGKTFIFERSSS